ncbi:MAG: hypothetical protein EOO05_15640 [Chitinophagaceae bacterium]|nr:MAG: hypothetical protein EOO05_15640 [Chitinophagaceae bacterium]
MNLPKAGRWKKSFDSDMIGSASFNNHNMNRLTCLLLVIFGSFTLNAQDRDISYLSSGGKIKPLQAIMDVRHYTLSLDIDVANKSIAGFTEIDVILAEASDSLLFDLLHFYKVSRVSVDKKQQTVSQVHDSVFIIGSKTFASGRHKVRIEYSGIPPVAVHPPWEGGFTWSHDSHNNPWVVINCQLEGGKIYFPCKDHPSDEPNEGVDLFITVPAGLTVAGPGLLREVSKPKNGKQTFHWKTSYTISNYCIVFNVAKYAVVSGVFTTIENHQVPVQFYSLVDDTARAAHLITLRIRDAHILEKYFGEYPWAKEKMGIAQVPNPGMEHQTMITYGDSMPPVKHAGFEYSDNLFHEFTHEWWANKVTNIDWAHFWIQEGIATYADALFFREMQGEKGYDSIMVQTKSSIRNQVPVVMGEGLNSAETYNGDIYSKGAFFMHSLRYVLGDSLFFPALKRLSTDVVYPYDRFLSTDDVEKHFSAAAGLNLKPYFDFFLRTNNTLDIQVRQVRSGVFAIYSENSPMDLPLDVLTDHGTEHLELKPGRNKGARIKSSTWPVVDPRGWYFKRVINY